MELADAAAAWLRDGFMVLPGYLAYSTDTFHWGTEITAPRSARYSAHVSYKHADNLWTGRHARGRPLLPPGLEPVRRAGLDAAARALRLPRRATPTGRRRPSPSSPSGTRASTRGDGAVRCSR
jgi:hypothetical protein